MYLISDTAEHDANVAGDPLEVESFSQTGFQANATMSSTSSTVNYIRHQEKGITVKILHRYQFSSALKRMSVVAEVAHKNKKCPVLTTRQFVFSKGAPEVMRKYIREIPSNYEATYSLHMSKGRRVIALAFRPLEEDESPWSSGSISRAEAEANLMFLGFLVFDSTLKSDSKSVMNDLKWLHIPTVVITGDSAYTAADVARKLAMISKSKHLLILDDVSDEVVWKFVPGKITKASAGFSSGQNVDFDPMGIAPLAASYNLCVTGQALLALENSCHTSRHGLSFTEVLGRFCPHVRIYARMSPAQKEVIILAMNSVGMYTLMCGDGTNVSVQ